MWAWMFPPQQPAQPQAAPQVGETPHDDAKSRPLPGELYQPIEDDTLFRSADRVPFFTTMDWLQQTPHSEIVAASGGRVAYAQLFQQPDHYRGQLVTVTGTLRQVSTRRRSPDEGDIDQQGDDAEGNATAPGAAIERWHEFFLQPDDHRSEPILIYALNLPEGYPESGRMKQPASVTGVFFKRLVYGAANEPALAPLLLAKQVELTGPAQQAATEESTIDMIVISGVIALLAATVFLFAYRRVTSGKKGSAERSAEAILARLERRRGE